MLKLPLASFPVLETERLLLREPDPADAPDLFVLRSDERVNEFIERKIPATEADALAFIERVTGDTGAGKSFYWVICQKDRPGAIGTICCWNIAPEKDQGELGYELLPSFQGQGLMQEAVAAVLIFLKDVVSMRRIEAITSSRNEASLRVLTRNGFKRDLQAEAETDMAAEAEGAVIYSLLVD